MSRAIPLNPIGLSSESFIGDTDTDPIGETPLTTKLPAGSHTLIFQADGFETTIETIRVRPQRRRQRFSVTLEPLPDGFVVLESDDGESLDGVKVTIDGVRKRYIDGRRLRVPAGPHSVRVTRRGFREFSDFIEH